MGEEKVKRPVYKKWWFWLIMGVATLIVVGAIIGAMFGGGQDENSSGGNTTDSNSSQIQPASVYYIGDTVAAGDAEYKVSGVYDTTLLGSTVLGAQTENNFVVVQLTVKNIKNSKITVYDSWFSLKKGDSKYDLNSGSIYLENGFYVLQEIGSGLTKTIVLAFETPTKNSDGAYTLVVNANSYLKSKEIVLATK